MAKQKKTQPEDYEIDLADYVRVLLKGKWLILGVFVASVVVAVGLSLVMAKVYEAEATLEIGQIGRSTQKGVSTLIEEPTQLLGKITGGAYGVSVREALGIEEKDFPEIKAESPKDTALVEITIESSNAQQAKDVLDRVNELILAEHQGKIDAKTTLLEEDITRLGTKIASVEGEKGVLEAKVTALQGTLLYQQTPGVQFALFDTQEKLAARVQEIEDLYTKINSLRRSLEDIERTEVVKSPVVPTEPVKPRPLLNGAIAAVLGLFLGTFLAFGKEWWETSLKSS